MKVLDLRCAAGHAFEGWFSSEDDFKSQRDGGLLDCPLCGSPEVSKLPSAPRLNISGAQAPAPADLKPSPASIPAPTTLVHGNAVSRFVEALADLMRNTEDVGTRFAEEARRIHYGEAEQKAIRGQTTPEERAALADEGIEVFTLPVARPPKSSLQ